MNDGFELDVEGLEIFIRNVGSAYPNSKDAAQALRLFGSMLADMHIGDLVDEWEGPDWKEPRVEEQVEDSDPLAQVTVKCRRLRFRTT